MEDMNTPEYLHKIKRSIFEMMRDRDSTPGIQIGGESEKSCRCTDLWMKGSICLRFQLIHVTSIAVPKMSHDDEDGKEDEDMQDPNVRVSGELFSRKPLHQFQHEWRYQQRVSSLFSPHLHSNSQRSR